MTDNNYVTSETGLLIDPETGEVIGDTKTAQDFVVNSHEALEWALLRRLEITTYLESKQKFYDTIAKQGAKELKRLNNQLAYWDRRHGADVEQYTRQQLEGKTQRFISTPYGEVTLRKTQPKVAIDNRERAIEWIRDNGPIDLIDEVYTLNLKNIKTAIFKGDNQLPEELFRLVPAGENFAIRLPNSAEPKEED